MPARPDSRFAGLPILEVRAPDGSLRRVIALRLRRRETGQVVGRHVLRDGELVDGVAHRVYGDENMWWRILDASAAVHPFDLRPGDALDLPGAGPATRAVRARSF